MIIITSIVNILANQEFDNIRPGIVIPYNIAPPNTRGYISKAEFRIYGDTSRNVYYELAIDGNKKYNVTLVGRFVIVRPDWKKSSFAGGGNFTLVQVPENPVAGEYILFKWDAVARLSSKINTGEKGFGLGFDLTLLHMGKLTIPIYSYSGFYTD